MNGTAKRCGYIYTGETGHESCCYRETWGNSERCVWHEETADDESKPIEALQDARASPTVREHNGNTGPTELLDGVEIRHVDFPSGTDFHGVSLRDADMAEVTLREATLSEADLADSTLIDADLRGADLSSAHCWEAELNDINLVDGTLEGVDLRESNCSDGVFRNARLHGANLEGAVFARADLLDADLTDIRAYGTVFSEARANEGTELDELCVYDPNREDGEADNTQLAKAEGTYQELESLCAENALLKPQSRYFIRRQDIHTTEHRREGQWNRWIRARISRAVVLYGESPFRVLAATAAVIVGSALLYPLGLLRSNVSGELLVYPPPTQPVALLTTLADSLYFSTLTFTTMTFGLYEPVGAGKFLTMVETGAGIVLMALLVFVFGRRATR
jgi:uncharacterized protein YjbI with pentapeptide repeats